MNSLSKKQSSNRGRSQKESQDFPVTIVKTTQFVEGKGKLKPDNITTHVQISRGVQGFVRAAKEGFKVVEFSYGAGSALLEVAASKLVAA